MNKVNKFCSKACHQKTHVPDLAISRPEFEKILVTLLDCLNDYSTDQRGDVGSWVRSASMACLLPLLQTIAQVDSRQEKDQRYLTTDAAGAIMGALLKQSVERIDKVRARAGTVIDSLLYQTPLDIPHRETLETYIQR